MSLSGLRDGRFTTSTTEVDGVPATVFATDDQIFAAVVWSKDGTVTAVAGTLARRDPVRRQKPAMTVGQHPHLHHEPA